MLPNSNNNSLNRFAHVLEAFQIAIFVFGSMNSPWFLTELRVFLCQKFKGYIENVFFIPGRAATPKKKSSTKSTTYFMSWEQWFARFYLPKNRHHSKIDLVIKMSKQFRDQDDKFLEVMSFRFLMA